MKSPPIVSDEPFALTSDTGRLAGVDERMMCARVVISTQARDRSGDVVRTLGIDTRNHQKNPVVFFDHAVSGVVMPIGRAVDPTGRYTVVIEEGRATATTYFSQKSQQAEEVFALIAEGMLAGASIGFKARKAQPLPPASRDPSSYGQGGIYIEECELIEYSHVPIPDNQDALLIKAIQTRRVGQTRLSPLTCKGLTRCVAEAEVRKQAKGMASAIVRAILNGLRPQIDSALDSARAIKRMRAEIKARVARARSEDNTQAAHAGGLADRIQAARSSRHPAGA